MASRLAGKVVLITGASSGIGASCAWQFAAAASRLVLCARRLNVLESMRSDILKKSPSANIHVIELDVACKRSVDTAINALPPDYSNIDVLVNNAGLARGVDALADVKETDYDEMMNTNVKGLVNVTQAVLRGMKTRGAGHIINIGSVAGEQAYPNGSIYCASKHAVAAISKSLTMELVATPLRVSHIAPGLVNTGFSLVRYSGDHAKADAVYEGIQPLTPEDIAEIVVFTASRPPHVQVNDVLVFPTAQASAYHVSRQQ